MNGHDYKDVFVEEAREQIDILNDRLLIIEKEPNNLKVINDIFRVAHTLKSSAAFVGLQELSDFCHKVEALLQKIRDKEIVLNEELMDDLFKSLDKIRDSVELFTEKDEIAKDFSVLSQRLDKYMITTSSTDESKVEAVDRNNSNEKTEFVFDTQQWQLIEKKHQEKALFYYVKALLEKDIKMKWVRAELLYVNMENFGVVISSVPLPNEFKTEKLTDTVEAVIAVKDIDPVEIKNRLDIDLVHEILVEEWTYEKLAELKEQVTEPGVESEALQEDTKEVTKKETPQDLPEQKQEIKDKIPGQKSETEDELEAEVSELSEEQINHSEDFEAKSILTKSETVRVPIKKLDELLNLVGELAITNSGFVEVYDRLHGSLGNKEIVSEFEEKIDQLSGIARNLQEGIMQARMVPIGSVFTRFSRLVRDLSKNLDKKVEITFKGEETELDKKIIDVIGDPLIHLIRNSIDHGIESLNEREKANKNSLGNILFNAYQSGNHIFVEVSDDGQGLRKEDILNKALEKEIITDDQVSQLSENDIYNMIFIPGFSTKKEVTAISGRGVGMDVVVETVKSLNGNVSVKSQFGKGSVFTLSFPLTLAIVPAILIESGNEIYAIPLSNVVETIKVDNNDIKSVDFREVIQLRNNVIPLLNLNVVFEIYSRHSNDRIPIVICDFEDQQIGIVVDKLLGKREIVIKTLSQNYQEMKGIAGATILGNGQIALILDVPSLIEQSRSLHYRAGKSFRTDSNFFKTQQSKIMDFKMSNEKEEEIKKKIFQDFQIDENTNRLMKEIFKVALATSANNIKHFLSKEVALAVPEVEVHTFEKVKSTAKFAGREKMYFACLDLSEGLNGKVIIAMDEVGMELLFKEFIGAQPMDSPVGQSCINEIGNLLTAGITNTFSRALNIRAYPKAPVFAHESFQAFFIRLFNEHCKHNKYVWTIDTDIIVDSKVVKGKVFIFPFDESFKVIGKAILTKKDAFSFMLDS